MNRFTVARCYMICVLTQTSSLMVISSSLHLNNTSYFIALFTDQLFFVCVFFSTQLLYHILFHENLHIDNLLVIIVHNCIKCTVLSIKILTLPNENHWLDLSKAVEDMNWHKSKNLTSGLNGPLVQSERCLNWIMTRSLSWLQNH